MTTMTHSPVLTINLAAIRENYTILQNLAPQSTLAGVVKADAYGLGAVPITKALHQAGCTLFFTATLQEALDLKEQFPTLDFAVLNGLFPKQEPLFAKHHLIPVLNTYEQVKLWTYFYQNHQNPQSLQAPFIQVDTGMNRLGLHGDEIQKLHDTRPPFPLRAIMSHMGCADEPEHPLNQQQYTKFCEILGCFPKCAGSLAASGALLSNSDYHFQIIRAGIALYGGNPFHPKPSPLKPVVSLKAPILQIRKIAPNTTVGYGATWSSPTPRLVATVGIGYADGLPRCVGGRAHAYFKGKRLPLVGRVSMDSMAVDITDIEQLNLTNSLDILNNHYTINDLAQAANTIPYEILSRLGKRYKRRYVDNP